MQLSYRRRVPACAQGGSSGISSITSSSSSSSSSGSSRHASARALPHPSTEIGTTSRCIALPLPPVRSSCSRRCSRVQGVPPLHHDQAHEVLPASWRRALNSSQPGSAETTATNSRSRNGSANGSSKDGYSSNSGPVQSYQALFQGHAAGAGGSSSSSSVQRLATLRFSIVRAVEFGQKLRLVGSPDCLGAWDAAQGPDMKWQDGHKWTAHAELAAGSHAFKFVLVHRSGELEWEPGSNRVLDVPAAAAEMQVAGQWGVTSDTDTLLLSEQPVFNDRRRQQQQLVEAAEAADAAGDVNEPAAPAAAAAAAQAAEAMWSVLELDQQSQMQPPPRQAPAHAAAPHTAGGVSQQQIDLLLQSMKTELGPAGAEADAAAAAVDAAVEAAGGMPTPQQIQQLMQALKAELTPAGADAAATAAPAVAPSAPTASSGSNPAAAHDGSSSSIVTGSAGAAADVASTVQLNAQLAAHNNELVSALLGMRSELVSSIVEVTAAAQELELELAEVQQQVALLATEQFMSMMQHQQQQGLGAAGAAAVAAAALEGVIGGDHAAAAAGVEIERDNAAAGSSGQSSWRIRWKDGNGSSSSSSSSIYMQSLPAAGSHVRPQVQLDLAGLAAGSSLAGNLQLSPPVLTWRQEVLQFRQESKVLRSELHGLNDVLDSMEQQLVANTAALHGLQGAVRNDDSSSGAAAMPESQAAAAADLAAAVAAAAAEAGELSAGGSSGGSSGSDQLQEQLLARFDQLAVGLKEEVKHAMQAAAAAKQQPQAPTRKAVSLDDFASQLWTAPPPQELQRQQQQQQQQQGGWDLGGHTAADAAADDHFQEQQQRRTRGSVSAAREEAAAAVKLLGSHNVQQYHKGLLVCVMMAAGVWQEGLLDIIRGSAMRATWHAYKAVWSDELMSGCKQRLTTPQKALAELQRGSSSADELACHILWSLQELSTHSTRVALLLRQVCTVQEAALMQQLAPGSGQQQCAAVLLKWIAAAAGK